MKPLHTLLRAGSGVVRRAAGWLAPPPGVRVGASTPATISPATFDLDAPEVLGDPPAFYASLRGQGAVHYLPLNDCWIVLGFADVQSALGQPKLFSSRPWSYVDVVLAGADPPQHTAVRRIISREFSAATLDNLVVLASERARTLIRAELDVVVDFALPLSYDIGAQLIGADEDVAKELVEISEELTFSDQLTALLAPAARTRLYTTLVRDGAGLIGEAEAQSLVRLMWFAATSTTPGTIAWSVFHLLDDDAQRRAIQAQPDLLESFIEEVLRLHPAEHLIARVTTDAAELGNVRIPAGAMVQLAVLSANRDPKRFEDPDVLRLDRAPHRHLSMGHGVHYCAGAPLARRVADKALRALFHEMPTFRAAQPLASVPYFRSRTTLFPQHLGIRR